MATGKYAAETSVSAEQSRMEIERLLRKYEADQFMYGHDGDRALVMFRMHGRHIRFVLSLPTEEEHMLTPARRRRTATQAKAATEQATRQRWRALKLVIQAKLEAVASGIVSFEEEFLAQIILPDNSTVGEFMAPQVERAYTHAVMPSILPALEA